MDVILGFFGLCKTDEGRTQRNRDHRYVHGVEEVPLKYEARAVAGYAANVTIGRAIPVISLPDKPSKTFRIH